MKARPFRRAEPAPPEGRLERELARREAAAAEATPEARGYHLNRCGDLALEAGQQLRAVRFFGRAVEAYLRVGYWRPAGAMCRKILRIHPEAVQTHCVLACVALHEHQMDDVRRHVADFVELSRRTGAQHLTILRLRLLAPLVRDAEVRDFVVRCLDEMCDDVGCERIHRARLAPVYADESLPATVEKLIRIGTADAAEVWSY